MNQDQGSDYLRRSIALWLIDGAAAVPSSGLAEEPSTITISKGDEINLTLSPLTGGEGAAATKTLQNDMTLSGYFALSGNAA